MRSDKNSLPESDFIYECFEYDPTDGRLYWKERPPYHFSKLSAMKTVNTRSAGKEVGTPNGKGYLTVRLTYKGKVKNYLVHRIIWKMFNYDPCDLLIDHINGNILDNRLENLRACTSSQNLGNMHKVKRNGLQGAFYLKDRGKWRSAIKVEGVTHYLGTFNSEMDAHLAYKKAKEERNNKF